MTFQETMDTPLWLVWRRFRIHALARKHSITVKYGTTALAFPSNKKVILEPIRDEFKALTALHEIAHVVLDHDQDDELILAQEIEAWQWAEKNYGKTSLGSKQNMATCVATHMIGLLERGVEILDTDPAWNFVDCQVGADMKDFYVGQARAYGYQALDHLGDSVQSFKTKKRLDNIFRVEQMSTAKTSQFVNLVS